MPQIYNEMDVFMVASTEDGTPNPALKLLHVVDLLFQIVLVICLSLLLMGIMVFL
jgi:hypothetical protein